MNDGVFIPGVVQNGDGTYSENLGEEGTMFVPYIIAYPWSFTNSSTFDADFVKLREISLSYQFPPRITSKLKIQGLVVSVYSRNIILWTKAKLGVDPERAFQAESGGFKQGIERYNIEPWVIPIGMVMIAATITVFQPQKVAQAILLLHRRTPQVRCTL